MYIDHAHSGTMLRHVVIVCKQLFYHFFGHTKSVIPDFDADIISVTISCHMNLTLVIHTFDTIIDGIFQKRLNDQLHRAAVFDLVRNLEIYLKTVLVADFLNVHVILCMLHLIFNPDNRLSFAQADPEQTCQL